MTVQELIDELLQVKDKAVVVEMFAVGELYPVLATQVWKKDNGERIFELGGWAPIEEKCTTIIPMDYSSETGWRYH